MHVMLQWKRAACLSVSVIRRSIAMSAEKSYLYKREYQKPVENEVTEGKAKKGTSSSDSRKRSGHKHIYNKIILHYGSDSFAWGRQCEICGRIDSAYKASFRDPKAFKVTGDGFYGEWSTICLTEIKRRFPEYVLMTLRNGEWMEWTEDTDK